MPEAILDSLGLPAFLRVVVKKYQPPLATRGKSEKQLHVNTPARQGHGAGPISALGGVRIMYVRK